MARNCSSGEAVDVTKIGPGLDTRHVGVTAIATVAGRVVDKLG